MLPTEGEEDLLEQLSGELGIPEFLQDLPMLEDNAMSGHGTIYDSLINDIPTTSASSSLFPDFSNALIDAKDCMTIDFSTTTFPPSPSNSDTSSGGSMVEPKDCLVAPISFTEVSPPVSPPSMMNLPTLQSGSILSVPDLANIKIPIPKIQKPKVTNPPLILTSNQLAQLSNGGVLQLNAGNATTTTTAAAAATNGSMVIKSEPNPLTLGATPTVQNVSSDDLKSLKRQQRMIKNRESACLSRKKKKEYVTSLEEQLNGLAKENLQLKRENESLKQRLRQLEGSDPSGLKVGPNAKRATAVFALLCIVSLNIGSLSSVYKSNQDSLLQPHHDDIAANFKVVDKDYSVNNHIVHGSGRSLLWAPAADPSSESNNTDYVPKCSLYFNQSESIRLDKQLRGWFQPEESLRNVTKEKDAPISPIVKVQKEQPSVTSLGPYAKPKASRLSSGFYQMLISDPEYKTGITLYNQDTPRFTYESFFEAIHRRDDTFYVVSFSGDHLLLPASARNGSSRPRMSLLLPSLTVPLNDSMQPPENHVAMMQIDCEVINTRLLHIHQDSIPAHLSQGMRAEASNASLQRNDSHEEQGIHHHQYEEFNATRPLPPKYRSHLYKKTSTSNQNPSLENTDYIEDGNYIQLPPSKSRNLNANLANKKRRHFKLSEHRFTP